MNTLRCFLLVFALVCVPVSLAEQCLPSTDVVNQIGISEIVLTNTTGKNLTYKVEPVGSSTVRPITGTVANQVRIGSFPDGYYRITVWYGGMMSYRTYHVNKTTYINVRMVTSGNRSWLEIY